MANGDAFTDYLSGSGWGSLSPAVGQMVLQELPQAAYFSSPMGQQFGAASPRRSRYMQNAYSDVYGQYLGEIGRAFREGQAPATFMDFLETDPWTQRYSQLPQYERGVTQTATNPRTRFIFYYCLLKNKDKDSEKLIDQGN